MNSLNISFTLRVLDTKNIIPHEEFVESRSDPIMNKIKKMNIFLNPILVAHVKANTYMQIDGMNRLSAIKRLGIKSILAQVVDYNDQQTVDVSTWCHLTNFKKDALLEAISKIAGITVDKVGFRYLRHRFIKDEGMGYLCALSFKDSSVYRVGSNGRLSDKINTLRSVVDIYKKNLHRDILRVDADSVDVLELFKKHSLSESMIIFPTFTRHQVINVAVHEKIVFPTGVTRFIVKGRCLDVNYPLKYLSNNSSEEEKNKTLNKFLKNKQYRTYEEPTIYFEPSI